MREHGAVPAAIAIMDGHVTIGLDESQLQKIAQAGTEAMKCSRRDIPFVAVRDFCACNISVLVLVQFVCMSR